MKIFNYSSLIFRHYILPDNFINLIITCYTAGVIFDANNQTFLTHVREIIHDDFPIVDGVGYFVYCAQDSFLDRPDVSITSVNVRIYEDWDIVGWYHDYSTTVESVGENISGTSVVTIFDARAQQFIIHVVDVPMIILLLNEVWVCVSIPVTGFGGRAKYNKSWQTYHDSGANLPSK